MIVALPTLVLPYPVLRVFIRSYARTSLWLLRVVCGTKVEWRGAEKIPKTRVHRRLQASIGLGDIRALRRARRSDLHPQARVDVDSAVRLVHVEGGPHPDRPQRRNGGAGAHDGAGAAGARRRPASSSSFPRARGGRRAPSRATSPASSISTARPALPACRWRSIPDCIWPRRSLRRLPGTIVVEILDPIAPGLDKDDVLHAAAERNRDRRRALDRNRRQRSAIRKLNPDCPDRLIPCSPASRSASRCRSVSR